ncbi:hypothetical protein EMCRGX_G026350 [Ephydatia muelleri]
MQPLVDHIIKQDEKYGYEILQDQLSAKTVVHKSKREQHSNAASTLKNILPPSLAHAMDLSQEKGASTWLSVLPLEEYGFALYKRAFRDALALRYGWSPANAPLNCACGTHFSIQHVLSCRKSGTDEKSCNSNTVRKATANKSEERSHGNIKAQTYIQYFKMGAGPVNILLVFGMLGLGEMVSAERLLHCSQLETEDSLISNAHWKPDPGWPQCGMIIFDNASFRYSADTPVVLKPLSFIVQPGEKVGIIGRTGAGKSSLIQMLFRMAEHTGNISIDGVNIRDVELHELRKSISIIPQDPVLFSGSLKYNLDPFEEYNNSDLWNVLEQASNTFHTKSLHISHRLNTVICMDRIMVMDGGEIVEFDDPYMLLKDERSLLKKMVDRTGPSNSVQLYQMAEVAYLSRKKRHP